jgi:hypothetical protein
VQDMNKAVETIIEICKVFEEKSWFIDIVEKVEDVESVEGVEKVENVEKVDLLILLKMFWSSEY